MKTKKLNFLVLLMGIFMSLGLISMISHNTNLEDEVPKPLTVEQLTEDTDFNHFIREGIKITDKTERIVAYRKFVDEVLIVKYPQLAKITKKEVFETYVHKAGLEIYNYMILEKEYESQGLSTKQKETLLAKAKASDWDCNIYPCFCYCDSGCHYCCSYEGVGIPGSPSYECFEEVQCTPDYVVCH